MDAGNDNSILLLNNNCVVELGKLWFEECTVKSEAEEIEGRIMDVQTNRIHTMLLMDNGMVKCIGRNMYGECNVPKQYL